ncbi:MAG: 23S rRNA (pseudouridine(1915)-N(3))-methyltransferase RlmH [Candidatus Aminicenantales bacterium]
MRKTGRRAPTRLRILWPGKTKKPEWRALQEFYLARIRQLVPCELVEAKDAKGLKDREAEKIKKIEAENLEKHLGDDYIIGLFDRGMEMSSENLARFLGGRLSSQRPTAFVVGGFAGLASDLLEKAHLQLSLSRMTFSHELCRVALLEQIYRALTILKGKNYAK